MQINGMKFRQFFRWLSDSMKVRVRSTPGQRIKLPKTDDWANPWTSVNLEA
jgi:uncharacterized protein YegL